MYKSINSVNNYLQFQLFIYNYLILTLFIVAGDERCDGFAILRREIDDRFRDN